MLQVFSPQDRQNLVSLLNLSIDELEEGSNLWRLLRQAEDRDQRLSTDTANEIIDLTNQALILRGQIREDMATGTQYFKRYKEDGEYEAEFKDGGSTLKGKEDRLKTYKADIQRLLGYTNRANNNRLRTVWRGGGIQPQDVGRYNRWF